MEQSMSEKITAIVTGAASPSGIGRAAAKALAARGITVVATDRDGTVEVDGARIQDARTFAFDSPADGILDWNQSDVRFRSRTTGDTDGLDLILDQADTGIVKLKTAIFVAEKRLSSRA